MDSHKRNFSLIGKLRSNLTSEKFTHNISSSMHTTQIANDKPLTIRNRLQSMSSRRNRNPSESLQRACSTSSDRYKHSEGTDNLSKSVQNHMSTFYQSNLPRLNFRSYNKEALFNFHSDNKRPASDFKWFRSMRRPARSTLGDRSPSPYPESIRDYFHIKERSSSSWKKRGDLNYTINNLDLTAIAGEVYVGPSGKYCDSCRKDKYPLRLSVR
jgi:hypothetical protein